MMTLPAHVTEEQIREILNELGLGAIAQIDRAPAQDGVRFKWWVHMKDATALGKSLAEALATVERRKQEGEVDVWPKRIVVGKRRDDTEIYWQIYKTATVAERAAMMAQKAASAEKEKVKPRIVF